MGLGGPRRFTKASPPRLKTSQRSENAERVPSEEVSFSAAARSKSAESTSLMAKVLTVGLAATALAGCFGGGPASAVTSQQTTQPEVLEKLAPANPFELMRMEDGTIAISADLAREDAHVKPSSASIGFDSDANIAVKTQEGTTLCEQAETLGGQCLNEEQAVVPNGDVSYLIETFAREEGDIHRIEARPVGSDSLDGVSLNKLPDGTEVFSDNGSGLLRHDGSLQQYPDFKLGQ